jgi:uncharacterized protein (TIGR03435 family)
MAKPALRAISLAALLSCGFAFAQSTPGPPPPAKPLAFDTVSIRPSKPGSNWMFGWGTTPDGYRVSGQSLFSTLMIAYFPQGMAYWSPARLSGAPSWLNDLYDIDAKVSEADLPEWQKQGLSLDKKPMLRAMLQTMLADRLHLVAHLAPGPPIPGWSLEPNKHGPHFTESKPGETLPPGMKLASGGVVVPYQRGDVPHITFYGATMADFAADLSQMSTGHPVLDHTGLTGHYDFVLTWVDDPDSKVPAGAISSDDPDPLSHWNVDALGLHVTPTKIPADTLVIEHIEKPSTN